MADFALIGAHKADRMGNVVYRKTSRNFGPGDGDRCKRHSHAGAPDRGNR